ncbi:MAG: hypothetical protein IJS05_06775, partial [Paludibacteraceae bacterium]|nr:hypothetical protein [Paludibacteraceae bacterium]
GCCKKAQKCEEGKECCGDKKECCKKDGCCKKDSTCCKMEQEAVETEAVGDAVTPQNDVTE